MALNRYIIERDIPEVGTLERQQLAEAAAKSNEALTALGPDIQWVESFVAAEQDLLRLSGEGRGHHPQACGDQRLPRDEGDRHRQDHRPDHRKGRLTQGHWRGLRGCAAHVAAAPSRRQAMQRPRVRPLFGSDPLSAGLGKFVARLHSASSGRRFPSRYPPAQAPSSPTGPPCRSGSATACPARTADDPPSG